MKKKIIAGLLLSAPILLISIVVGLNVGWVAGLLTYLIVCLTIVSMAVGMAMFE